MNKLALIATLALVFSLAAATAPAHCTLEDPNAAGKCAAGKCDTHYGVDATSGACDACSDSVNCITCDNDATKCGTCATGYYADTNGACQMCSAGQGLKSGTGACTACTDPNCNDCHVDNTKCTDCKDKFGFKSGTCTACKDTNCKTCDAAYDTCTTCSDGFALDTTNTCTACTNGCKTCNAVGDSCSACPTGQTLNTTTSTAQFCCPVNCAGCNSTSYCTSCNSGFNLNKDKGTCFGFKTGASLTLGAIVSVALFSLLF